MSLAFTRISHRRTERITIVCNAYENFHANNPPITTNFLREMLSLILKENSFQTHGTAMGTKMAVAFANIFMASIEKEILRILPGFAGVLWKKNRTRASFNKPLTNYISL